MKKFSKDWFFKQLVPSVREHLRSENLPERAMLLLDNAPSHPNDSILKTRDGTIFVAYLFQTSRHFCIQWIKAYWKHSSVVIGKLCCGQTLKKTEISASFIRNGQ
jgi:hypothetical protein